eukprot:GEZU01012523.1.p1 GENE.GEZU01012523.1~~GEZU01012523.1.p1  ORF type:complete len:314 (-),score=131.02 GEZU01012523.1:403-1344(-)
MSKIKEADELFKEAKKLSTKSLFRWKPEYDQAATKYEKAGNLYKHSKENAKAVEAFLKASECHYLAENVYLAGKELETAGNICRDDKDNARACELYRKAAEIFLEDGKPDKAASLFTSAARIAEDVDKAVELYKRAIDVFVDEEKYVMSGDAFRTFNAFLLRNGRIVDAIENIKKQIKAFEALDQPHNVWKAYLSIIVLHLYNNDWVAADNEMSNFIQNEGFARTIERELADRLLDAYDQRDSEELEKTIKEQHFTFLENEVGKLALKLRVLGEKRAGSRPSRRRRQVEDSDEEGEHGGAGAEEEEEGEIDLR